MGLDGIIGIVVLMLVVAALVKYVFPVRQVMRTAARRHVRTTSR
jgi:hypothetical protein